MDSFSQQMAAVIIIYSVRMEGHQSTGAWGASATAGKDFGEIAVSMVRGFNFFISASMQR